MVLPVASNTSASVSAAQNQLEKLDLSDDDYQPLLRELLSHKGLRLHIQGLDGSKLEAFVELLDKVGNVDTDIRRELI